MLEENKSLYKNRSDAGKILANQLVSLAKDDPLILALPRGGVPVGFEIAQKLRAPFDVIVVRKIGAPSNPEFGIGALSEDGTLILDGQTLNKLQLTEKDISRIIQKERKEVKRRRTLYRNNKPLPKLTGKAVILVDDGLATGMTAQAAVEAVTRENPHQIVFAAPVCSLDRAQFLRSKADQVVCLATPQDFGSVGEYYENFEQVSDKEVIELLSKEKSWEMKDCILSLSRVIIISRK